MHWMTVEVPSMLVLRKRRQGDYEDKSALQRRAGMVDLGLHPLGSLQILSKLTHIISWVD